jgi:hypothetical protein
MLSATPKAIYRKKITKKAIFIFQAIAFLILTFNIADLVLNSDIQNSAFVTGTFDNRGFSVKFSFIRFIVTGFEPLIIPSFIILSYLKYNLSAKVAKYSLFISILASLANPSKGTLINFIYLVLNFFFWKKVLVPSEEKKYLYPIVRLNKLSMSKKLAKLLVSVALLSILFIFLTIIFIAYTMQLNPQDSFDLFKVRMIDSSYDLLFSIISDKRVDLGLNSPASEFPTILHLWVKAFSKNIFGFVYIHDTIPKYVDYIRSDGISNYGISSPNSNLLVESVMIHGRFLGLLTLLIVCYLCKWARFAFLEARSLTSWHILLIPITQFGPFFLFQSAQQTMTAYLPIVIICFAIMFFYDMVIARKISEKPC